MIFWHNLLRYPRFFVSAMFGLVLILLNPFLQKKNSRLTGLFLILIISSIFLLWVLKNMLIFE